MSDFLPIAAQQEAVTQIVENILDSDYLKWDGVELEVILDENGNCYQEVLPEFLHDSIELSYEPDFSFPSSDKFHLWQFLIIYFNAVPISGTS